MAIFNPTELQFSDQKFSMIIYGQPGVGKTTLAASAPKPVLFDLDKGVQRVRAQHRPMTSRVATYEEMLEDVSSLAKTDCETIIIDTGGALITLMMDYVMRKDNVNKTKSGALSIKGFGAVKQEFIRLTNMLKTNFNKNIIYVFHSLEEKDKDGSPVQRLMCEGSAKTIVWQPCDFGMYVFMKGDQRVGGFTPTDEYFAKGCYKIEGIREIPKLGAGDKNDFITRLFEEANSNIALDNDFFVEENEIYEKAMTDGKAMIEGIDSPEKALDVANAIKGMEHRLTSQAELRQILKDKTKELDYTWSKEKNCYVMKDQPKAEAEELKEEPKPENAPVNQEPQQTGTNSPETEKPFVSEPASEKPARKAKSNRVDVSDITEG